MSSLEDYDIYHTQLWEVYDEYSVQDEQRIESILTGLKRVEESLIKELEVQEAEVELIEWPVNGPPAWELPTRHSPSICNRSRGLQTYDLSSWGAWCNS